MSVEIRISIGGRTMLADLAHGHDLSLPLDFNGAQPAFFGAPAAGESAYAAGSFIGNVGHGGSCNCSTYTLTPHCNGTHTECAGHVTRQLLSIRDVAPLEPLLARLVTVRAEGAIEIEHLNQRPLQGHTAVVIRTMPNAADKRSRNYDQQPQVHLSPAAMRWLVSAGVEHLVCDLPSVDPAHDNGLLAAHRIFWGLNAGETDATLIGRAACTITELAFIDSAIADGDYLLSLQVAPFVADAAPSRPILYPLRPA